MAVHARTEGLEKLAARWATVKAAARANIEAAGDKSVKEFVTRAQAIAPVDHGELRDSVHGGRSPKKPMAWYVMAGADRPSKHGGTLHDEARMVEFGTQKTRAQPFFLTTWRVLKKRTRGRMNRAMLAAVKLQRSDGD